jgi:hypothetical protein
MREWYPGRERVCGTTYGTILTPRPFFRPFWVVDFRFVATLGLCDVLKQKIQETKTIFGEQPNRGLRG